MELIANRTVVEQELKRARRARDQRNTVLLLRAAPQWRGDERFTADDNGTPVPVTVAACATVLSVLAALSGQREPGRYLVVLTPCTDRELGDSVLARAMGFAVKPVNRWDLVQDAFGAPRLDPALLRRDNRWIAEALLDAQPAGGWRRLTGPVLTRTTALNRLAATRFGTDAAGDDPVDAAALLQWTTDPAAVAGFWQLQESERTELVKWLKETAGDVADVVFRLAAADRAASGHGAGSGGRVGDAVPFGLAAAVLYAEPENSRERDVIGARVRAEERYLGGNPQDGDQLSHDALRAFAASAESLITRWTGNGHADHVRRAAALCERAIVILGELAGTEEARRALAGRSTVLETGLDARLAALADAITRFLPAPASLEALGDAGQALNAATGHGRSREHHAEIRAAAAAVSLMRWLADPEDAPDTLSDAASRMLRSWSWADRALGAIEHPDTGRVPVLAEAYAALWARGRQGRAVLDEAFARKLAAWTERGSTTDLLGVENVLEQVVRPLAAKRLPVLIVLDGMSAANATAFAEEITGRGLWLEAGRKADGREPVLATVPSITVISRTSLLCGALTRGGQDEERTGFAGFWSRRKAALFHKADLAPEPGRPLAVAVRDAIADRDTVVGVVLNTIDDALDRGRQGDAHWTVAAVPYLGPILDEARRAGRPVILTADHGHVLDHGDALGQGDVSDRAAVPDGGPGASDGASAGSAARYRTGGSPRPGEIIVRGPRVLGEGGEVVAAVDETIRYAQRRAGYHGGASAAEVVIPVITLLPSESLLPSGWFLYDRNGHAPAWWLDPDAAAADLIAGGRPPRPAASPAGGSSPAPSSARRKRHADPAADDGNALFPVQDVAASPGPEPSLGARIVASPRMAAQRQLLRRPPSPESVVALIDALAAAGGLLTMPEAAAAAGEPPVRMSGYLAQIVRLLNVDSYAVLQTTDDGRSVELKTQLLRQQFLSD